MIKILTALYESFKETNPLVTMLLGVATFLAGLFTYLNETWGQWIVKLGTIVLPEPIEGPVLSGYAFLNYCFPVQETFAFLSTYCVVIAVCAFARIVKSFLPTIN
jgi:hypothetical protein